MVEIQPWWAIVLSFLLIQCTPVQQNTPEATMLSLFHIAEKDTLNDLALLCDPKAENDGDTDCLCALSSDYTPHECSATSHNRIHTKTFQQSFRNGSLTGKTAYPAAHIAKVPFQVFGGKLNFSETMTLIKRNKKWYLLSF